MNRIEALPFNGGLLQWRLADLGLNLCDTLIEINDQRKAVTILVGSLSTLSLQRHQALGKSVKLRRPRPVR